MEFLALPLNYYMRSLCHVFQWTCKVYMLDKAMLVLNSLGLGLIPLAISPIKKNNYHFTCWFPSSSKSLIRVEMWRRWVSCFFVVCRNLHGYWVLISVIEDSLIFFFSSVCKKSCNYSKTLKFCVLIAEENI